MLEKDEWTRYSNEKTCVVQDSKSDEDALCATVVEDIRTFESYGACFLRVGLEGIHSLEHVLYILLA